MYIVSDKKDFSYTINVYSNMNFWNSIQQNNWYSLLKDFPYEIFTKKELENMNFYLKGYNHDTQREEKYYFGKILLKNATNTYFLLFKPYYSFMFDPFTFEIEIASEKRPEFTDGDNIQIFGDGINNISSPINVQTLTQMNFTLFKEMHHGNRHQFSYFTAQGWDLSTGIYSFSETRDIRNKFFDVSINSVFTTIHNDLPVLDNKWVLSKTNFKYSDKYYSFNEDIFNTTEISGDYSGGAYASLRTQISNNLPNFIDKVSFRGWSGESFNIRKIVYINNNVYSEKNVLNQILIDLNTDDLETKIFYNP